MAADSLGFVYANIVPKCLNDGADKAKFQYKLLIDDTARGIYYKHYAEVLSRTILNQMNI